MGAGRAGRERRGEREKREQGWKERVEQDAPLVFPSLCDNTRVPPPHIQRTPHALRVWGAPSLSQSHSLGTRAPVLDASPARRACTVESISCIAAPGHAPPPSSGRSGGWAGWEGCGRAGIDDYVTSIPGQPGSHPGRPLRPAPRHKKYGARRQLAAAPARARPCRRSAGHRHHPPGHRGVPSQSQKDCGLPGPGRDRAGDVRPRPRPARQGRLSLARGGLCHGLGERAPGQGGGGGHRGGGDQGIRGRARDRP